MSSIATYSFMSLHGLPSFAGTKVDDITRQGVPGKAFWPVGKAAEPFPVTTLTACADYQTVVAVLEAYAALESAMVTVVDDHGVSWLNMMVRNVRPLGEAINASGGTQPGVGYYLVCEWTLEHIWV